MGIAFVFSGQGSQYAGMGKELYDSYDACRQVFGQADEALGFSLTELCFGQDPRINETEYTQPAILTMSVACMRLIEEAGVRADYMAGLSLGEYSALVASQALSYEEAVVLVRKRGRFMTEAVPTGAGVMSAIMGLDRSDVEALCDRVDGVVAPANYNSPRQIVIAGETESVIKAEEEVSALGGRAIRLKVSGPFHTPLLASAAVRLEEELRGIHIGDMRTPVVSNFTGKIIPSSETIIPTLVNQVMSPVLWEDGVNELISLGVDTFVELGPGRTLCSFIKKINRGMRTYNVENIKSFEKTLEEL